MRLVIPDLIPGTPYLIQVRANNGAQQSEWSPAFALTTEEDKTPPVAPTGLTWVSTGDSFFAEWNSVGLNIIGAAAVVVRYELELTASGTTRIVSTTQQTGQKPNYSLSFENNRALFGTPRASVSLRVRAIDNRGNASAWTTSVNAQNPVPTAPTNVVATAGTNQISLNWTPDTSATNNDVIGFNVYTSSNTLLGFVNGTSFVYRTTTYSPQTFKVAAVDKFNQESTRADSNTVTPESPFASDTTPPAVPALSGTLTNNPNGLGALAELTWTQTLPDPNDLAGFEIRYRRNKDAVYSSGGSYDAAARNAIVEVPDAYTQYVFQIRSVDRYANYSAWSSDLSISPASSTAPEKVSGVVSVPGREEIRYSWNATNRPDLKNYEAVISTSSTFANGNITFLTGTSATLVISGLNPNTTYYFRVRQVTAEPLTGPWSDTDTETTVQQINGNDITEITADKIKAGTLGGTNGSGVIQVAAGSSLVFNGGFLKSNTYTQNAYAESASAGWYLGNDGLRIAQGSVSANALKSGVLTSATVVIGTGGAVQSENYGAQPPQGQNPAGFRLSSTGLDIPDGSLSARKLIIADNTFGFNGSGQITEINGGMIKTGAIRSTVTRDIDGEQVPLWEINLGGAARFANLLVMGDSVLGKGETDKDSIFSSSNYIPGAQGFQLRADGTADLAGLKLGPGGLMAVGTNGASIGFTTTEGFYVNGPIPAGQAKGPNYITFPITPAADGSMAPNIISGVLNATTVSVRGNEKGEAASLFAKNYMELNSSLILRNRVSAAVSSPQVTTTHVYKGMPVVSGFRPLGNVAYASSGSTSYCLYKSSGGAIRLYTLSDNPTFINLSGVPANIPGPNGGNINYMEPKNIAVLNNELFIMGGEHIYSGSGFSYQMAVYAYNLTTGVYQRRGVVSPVHGYFDVIQNAYSVGTGPSAVYVSNPFNTGSNPNFQFRSYVPGNLTSPTATVNTSISTGYRTGAFVVAQGDLGNLRFVVPSFETNSNTFGSAVLSINISDGSLVASESWSSGKYPLTGTAYDYGTGLFMGYTSSNISETGTPGTIQYSQNKWNTTSATQTWAVAVSKYSQETGNESDISGITYFTMNKRSYAQVTADSGNASAQRVYFSNASGTPTLGQLWRQSELLGSGISSRIYGNVVFSGNSATAKGPGFPEESGNAGVLISQAVDTPPYSTSANRSNGSKTLLENTPEGGTFRQAMVGNVITGTGIPEGTVVESVNSATSITMSKPATSGGTATVTIIRPLIELRGSGYARIKELYSDQGMFASGVEANASAGNKPPLRVGNSFGNHLRISDDRIIAMDNDNTQADLYLNVNGITLTSKLIVTSSTDASTGAGNEPPLRIGDVNGAHLRIDGNEILAMSNNNTGGNTFLLNTGGIVQMGGFQFGSGTITALTGSVDFSVPNGNLRINSASNIAGRIETIFSSQTGASIALRNNMVVAGIQGFNSASPAASNTVQFYANGLFATDQTGTSAAAAQIGTGGRIQRSTSSRRYKDNIKPMDLADARKALNLESVTFLLKDDLGHGIRRRRYPGFIAEQAHDAGMNLWVVYDDQDRPDSFRYPEITAAHNMLIKELYGKIETLEATNSTIVEEKMALEDRLAGLETKVDQILAGLGS